MSLQKRALPVILSLLLILSALPAADPAQAQAGNPTECLTAFDPNQDYFPEKASLQHAEGFSVEYHGHYKVVQVTRPWQDATTQFEYALVQCGAPVPEGFTDEQVIEVPIKSIIAMSTAYLPPLVTLGVVDTLVGVDSLDFTYTPEVLARGAEGKVKAIGSGPQVNLDEVALLEPDVIMTYGIGVPDYDAHPKLIEAGFQVVMNGDFIETSPLARAEWIKFIALFYNLEGAANAQFDEMAAEYARLSELVADSVQAAAQPTVIFNTPFDGTWYIPGGNSYVARLLKDAGGTYAWAGDETVGSLPLGIEVVFEAAGDAQIWLNPGFYFDLKSLETADARLAEFAAYKAGAVFNNTARLSPGGGFDYWESGVNNPHVLLADLIHILHPDLLPDHDLVYYVQLK